MKLFEFVLMNEEGTVLREYGKGVDENDARKKLNVVDGFFCIQIFECSDTFPF